MNYFCVNLTIIMAHVDDVFLNAISCKVYPNFDIPLLPNITILS